MKKSRTLHNTVLEVSKSYSVLLVTGPRQVGKSTLLADCSAGSARKYVTLDDPEQRRLANEDPALFLQTHPSPVTIDEVQYAPDLFPLIKMIVDREQQPGMYWLTGSQKFHLMQGITESLAGRVAVLDMLGLSLAEQDDYAEQVQPFLPTKEFLAQQTVKPKRQLADIFTRIWRGSLPKIALDDALDRDLYYKSYVETYLRRDVRDLLNITDELAFGRFLRTVAARTGQMLNYSAIARDVDVDHKTVKAWLSVLETSGLIYLLHPWHNNTKKRLIKTPKLYFLDTGLCSFLTRWPTPESLEAGAMSGAILETFLFTELLKSYWHVGKAPYFYYYRDADQKEVDLLIESGDTLHPVEFKKTASPGKNATRQFTVLEKLGKTIGHGAVLCFCESPVPLSRTVDAVPVACL